MKASKRHVTEFEIQYSRKKENNTKKLNKTVLSKSLNELNITNINETINLENENNSLDGITHDGGMSMITDAFSIASRLETKQFIDYKQIPHLNPITAAELELIRDFAYENHKKLSEVLTKTTSADSRTNGVGSKGGHIAREYKAPGPHNGHNSIKDEERLIRNSEDSSDNKSYALKPPKILNHQPWDNRTVNRIFKDENNRIVKVFTDSFFRNSVTELVESGISTPSDFSLPKTKSIEMEQLSKNEQKLIEMLSPDLSANDNIILEETVHHSHEQIETGKSSKFNKKIILPSINKSKCNLNKKIGGVTYQAIDDNRSFWIEKCLAPISKSINDFNYFDFTVLSKVQAGNDFGVHLLGYICILLGINHTYDLIKASLLRELSQFQRFLQGVDIMSVPVRRLRKANLFFIENLEKCNDYVMRPELLQRSRDWTFVEAKSLSKLHKWVKSFNYTSCIILKVAEWRKIQQTLPDDVTINLIEEKKSSANNSPSKRVSPIKASPSPEKVRSTSPGMEFFPEAFYWELAAMDIANTLYNKDPVSSNNNSSNEISNNNSDGEYGIYDDFDEDEDEEAISKPIESPIVPPPVVNEIDNLVHTQNKEENAVVKDDAEEDDYEDNYEDDEYGDDGFGDEDDSNEKKKIEEDLIDAAAKKEKVEEKSRLEKKRLEDESNEAKRIEDELIAEKSRIEEEVKIESQRIDDYAAIEKELSGEPVETTVTDVSVIEKEIVKDDEDDDYGDDEFGEEEEEETVLETPFVQPVNDTPIVIEKPVINDNPVVIEEPVINDTPIVIEEPVINDTPVVIEKSVINDTPIVIEEPVINDTPIVTEEPVNDTPIVIEEPVINDTPVVIEKPVINDTPIVIEEPVINDTPVVVEEPVINDTPVVTEEPVINDTPIVIEEPVINDTPVVIEEPVSDTPIVIEEPVINDTPVEDDYGDDDFE
jgi:hypothetical protein